MLLMIDNYDSFTYNLVQYFYELGQEVEVYRNDVISIQEVENKKPKYLVISPGPCTPQEAGISAPPDRLRRSSVPMSGCPIPPRPRPKAAPARSPAPRPWPQARAPRPPRPAPRPG